MNSASALPASISSPGKGRVVRAFGDEAIFHFETKHTGGRLTLWTNIIPPGGGSSNRAHRRH